MELKEIFFQELASKTEEAKSALGSLLENPKDVSALNSAFRALHTMKGSARLVGFSNFQKLFHRLEDVLRSWRSDPSKVDPKTVSRILEILEYVSTKREDLSDSDLENAMGILEGRSVERETRVESQCGDFKELVEWILYELVELETHLVNDSKDLAMNTLSIVKRKLIKIHEELEYVPLEDVLKGFEVFVMRDATDLGKEVDFIARVEGAKVSKEDAGVLREALLHIIRNAVVHGIEKPDERERVGKDRKGKIVVEAELDGDNLVISVEDDGKGIDFEKLEEKAEELGVEYSDPKELLFVPSLSTREEVDEKGGRGVGLDAVKEYVDRKGGSISVLTKRGMGARFEMRIPVESFLKKILVVKRSNGIFGVELSKVEGVARIEEVFSDNGERYVSVEGRVYSLEDIGEGDFNFLVLSGNRALAIDEVVGIREAPVRLDESRVGFVNGFAVGIERFPVPIVDPAGIEGVEREGEGMGKVLVVDDSPLTRLVVSRLLRRFGFDVVDVPDGSSALKAMRSGDFDFAVVDLELPDMSGFDLVEIVKDVSPRTSIAVLTTAVTEENEKRARELGVEFFPKGENLDNLLNFLRGS